MTTRATRLDAASARAELRQDGDRCRACDRLLADAEHVRRVRLRDRVLVRATCACGVTTCVPWVES